jgi:hypothetical protein
MCASNFMRVECLIESLPPTLAIMRDLLWPFLLDLFALCAAHSIQVEGYKLEGKRGAIHDLYVSREKRTTGTEKRMAIEILFGVLAAVLHLGRLEWRIVFKAGPSH